MDLSLDSILSSTGFVGLTWGMVSMWVIVIVLLYLGIVKKFEPLLLIPISLGALLANLPIQDIILAEPNAAEHTAGGLFYYISQGVKLEIFPPIIFMGVGALTDFGPLIANPRTLLLGAAAQFGIFATFIGAHDAESFRNGSNSVLAMRLL
jgi:Na+-transporting methylmalonyl-CoA/oxaloacetate decarboxylase beta subunit